MASQQLLMDSPAAPGASKKRPLNRLTPEEVQRYHTDGYLMGYRIFNDAEVEHNRAEFEKIVRALKPGQTTYDINNFERHNRFIYSLATNPLVLDYVEDLLGPDILLWSTHCFCKNPGDGTSVAWHQDARYWPLHPHKNITVWLAFDDSDEGNGAMKVIPGTHRGKTLEHVDSRDDGNVLFLKIKSGEIDEAKARHIVLKAGEISFHDDDLVHGSDMNNSNRRRSGLTMRYVTPDVKCDLSVWSGFKTKLFRGVDRYDLNPHWEPTFE